LSWHDASDPILLLVAVPRQRLPRGGAPLEAQSLSPLTRDAKAAPYVSTVERLRDFHRATAGDFRYYVSSLDTNQNGDTTSTVLVTVEDANSERRTFQIAPGTLKVHRVKAVEAMGNAVKAIILSAESGKDEQVGLAFDQAKRQLLVTRGALPPTRMPESTPDLKAEKETATKKPRSPTWPTPEPARASEAPDKSQTLDDMAKAYGASEVADVNVPFNEGRFYKIGWNTKIAQVGDGFVLTSWELGPFAVLTFKNPGALNNFNLSQGAYIRAVGAFIKFKVFTMTEGGSQRLPVFECIGIEVNGKFIKTE
jgi:hypothetical protein